MLHFILADACASSNGFKVASDCVSTVQNSDLGKTISAFASGIAIVGVVLILIKNAGKIIHSGDKHKGAATAVVGILIMGLLVNVFTGGAMLLNIASSIDNAVANLISSLLPGA